MPKKSIKICSWNVDGIRAWIRKNGPNYVRGEKPDILCLQETKVSLDRIPPEADLEDYYSYWNASDKSGYAGVALYSKSEPLRVKYGLGNRDLDSEGRLITAEYAKFYLVAAYFPNAGAGLKTLDKRMKWDKLFRRFIKNLDRKKAVVLAGDLNVAHQPIDLANPNSNKRHAGYTDEERNNFGSLLDAGFADTFRYFKPKAAKAYTFWTYIGAARSRNVGWRIDYFLVSDRFLKYVRQCKIKNKVEGSDHCPILLSLEL